MAGQVKVEDFEIFRLFRANLLKFAQSADQALSSADSDIARTQSWLETEQTTFWTAQHRKRTEAVKIAKEEVRKKKLYKDFTGRIPGAVEEEKALARCLKAVEEAEHKLAAIRKWLPKLQTAADLYRGGVMRLSTTIGGEIPKAVALLDRLAATLEEYTQIAAPAASVAEGAAPAAFEESVSRGGDEAAESIAKPEETPPTVPAAEGEEKPAAEAAAPVQEEGRHVAAGQ